LIISVQTQFASLGQTWVRLLAQILATGSPMAKEGLEILGTQVSFTAQEQVDPILDQFANQEMIRNMRDVFFSDSPNPLGHSYASLMRGPGGRNDLQDILGLLRSEPWTKRAVLTLCGSPNGKVPCINQVQFLVREGAVQTFYFGRGQDIFRKFYADGLCLAALARRVAQGLELPAAEITGLIASAHVYHEDLPGIRNVLEAVALPTPLAASSKR
jgi:thymidylate synthase